MPEGWSAPSPDQYYRALDAVAAAKDATEVHLYARLCDLSNLDLRLVCYDLTSTYFEGSARASDRFPSRAFGYSRDHRGDRPQIVIGLQRGRPRYEELLAGRHVLTTSLTPAQASTAQVVAAYRQLANIEARFRVLKDFLHLRPVRHWTEQRVRGHVAVCVYAAVIETLINHALATADVRDPDNGHQHLSAARALRELNRIRRVQLDAGGRQIALTTRRSTLRARALTAIGADTATWDKATIA